MSEVQRQVPPNHDNPTPEAVLRREIETNVAKAVQLEQQAAQHDRMAKALRQQAEELRRETEEFSAAADMIKRKAS